MPRLAALLSIAGVVFVIGAAPATDRGRPVILLVHGRGMVDRDTAATRRFWLDALRAGVKSVANDSLIADRDVRVVWYADVLDPRSPAGCDYVRDDPRARRESAEDPDIKTLVSLAGNLLQTLSALIADTEATSQLRGLASDASFLSDARKRCAAERRLADAIDRARGEGRPIIVVAHSLGSLVAYDYLSTRSDTVLVNRFVTIGSMLGSPELRHLAIGGDSTDTLSRPASVKEWINVRNEQDMFAVPVAAAHDVATNPPADEPDAHEMVGYLRGSATAKEVLVGWCAAFQANQPRGCGSVAPK
jgi:pimeloyl-ACP methyl ester carboxylesterase